jgi:hypothetical protein
MNYMNEDFKKKHTCSITGETYYGYGNNAYPFYGRCSNFANTFYVLPARCMGITRDDINAWYKGKKQREKNELLANAIFSYFLNNKDDFNTYKQMWEYTADDREENWAEEWSKKLNETK